MGRVRIPSAEGVLAAIGEATALKEVIGGGEKPSGVGFGFPLTRVRYRILSTHLE